MCNRSYRIAHGALPEQSDICLLCSAAPEGDSNLLGECERPAIEVFCTSRHNGALARGSQGGCFLLSDVSSVVNLPDFSSGTRLPWQVLRTSPFKWVQHSRAA